MFVTSLGVSLNSSNIIAPYRPLVNRLACPSWGVLMQRCRQQKPAKPAIRIERFSNSILNAKKNICILGN